MKRFYLISLLTCCLILFCFNSQAAGAEDNVNLPGEHRVYYHSEYRGNNRSWGQDILIAAVYPYGWRDGRFGQSFEGVMFPVYLGYLSFDDQGEQKMIHFTSCHTIDTTSLEKLFNILNNGGELLYGPEVFGMDFLNFDGILFEVLRAQYIGPILRMPLDTAKNFDFAFKEQTEFRLEEADSMSEDFLKPNFYFSEWGIYDDNFILTPKE